MKQPLKNLIPFLFCISALPVFATENDRLATIPPKKLSEIKMLSTFLVASNGNMADGNRVVFSEQYSNEVDGNDAVKMLNPGENFGLLRTPQILAVEARQPIAGGDTLFYNMSNLVPQIYKLLIVPENLSSPAINCELIDRFLNTRVFVNLNDTNRFNLEITSNPASKAANRLMVVFSSFSALPLKFTGITATNQANKMIAVNWRVEEEVNVDRYEIERSGDEINFSPVFTTRSVYNTSNGGGYMYNDHSPLAVNNFYRVRSISKDGKSFYSNVVEVSLSGIKATMIVSPNPVIGHKLQVQFSNVNRGFYQLQLLNYNGQPVYSNTIKIVDSNSSRIINLGNSISKGVYSFSLIGDDGNIITQSLIIQ